MCAPHTFVCGVEVDCLGIHGLACRKSTGRHFRHNAVNDLIERALASAEIPALLEQKSLSMDDGKRSDGLTVFPWANGYCLVWDFTCPDILAASHLNRAVVSPGSVANDAKDHNRRNIRHWHRFINFKPIALETIGALGECAVDCFQNLGRRIAVITGELRSSQLFERDSALQFRGGMPPAGSGLYRDHTDLMGMMISFRFNLCFNCFVWIFTREYSENFEVKI